MCVCVCRGGEPAGVDHMGIRTVMGGNRAAAAGSGATVAWRRRDVRFGWLGGDGRAMISVRVCAGDRATLGGLLNDDDV